MAIGDDTSIDYTNKIIDLTGTTVYNVSVLYSYCKEQFKLSANIDDDFAWTANTPTDFTLKNGWYLRTHSIRRLKNGSIKTTYGTNEIERLDFQSGGYTNAIESDIGKVVTGTGIPASSTLVDFDNTRLSWWIRTNGTATSVSSSTAIAITGGTGAGTTNAASVNGDDLWTNINTIGDLASTGQQPFMYVYTGDLGTGDFAGNARRNEGYEDDPDPALTNADRGAMDVLIRIKDMDVTLGNPAGFIRVYGRQGLFKFADFPIDISPGGRISVPIAQSNDTEDTIGEVAVAVDGQSATNFTVGEAITWTGGSAEVVEYIEGVNASTSVLILRGLTAYPANNTAITGATSGATGNTRGLVGGQLFTYDVETDGILEADYGITLTSGGASGWTGVLRGHLTITEGGGTNGYAIAETRHDYNATVTDYVTLGDNEVITGTGVNITSNIGTGRYDRLAYDLDDVQIKLAAWDLTVSSVGNAVVGDNITQDTSGAKGTILSIPDATSLIVSWNNTSAFNTSNTVSDDDGGTLSAIPSAATRVSTFSYALPLQSSKTYYGLINCNGRTASDAFHYIKYFQQARATASNSDPNTLNASPDQDRQLIMMKEELGAGGLIGQAIEGEEFFRAFTDEDTPSNNPTDQSADSRIAVKPGTAITTGQGWALINIASGDSNNYTLTAVDGSKNKPFTSVPVTLTNLVSGDHVEVVLDDGTGQEDVAQYNVSITVNVAGDADIVLDETLPNDTPTGTPEDIIIKVVDTDSTDPENKELRYRGASYSGSTVTFVAGETGTATAGSTGSTLKDTGAFAGTTIEVGDVIRNTTTSEYAWVKEIVDNDTIITSTTSGGSGWTSGNGWATNVLAYTHDGGETAYIPYIDRVADATSESETLTFVSNRNVVIRVRNTSIIDFDTTGTINSSGLSVGAVRNPDTVYTPT